ncbi:MAG: hypothetical protein IIX48_12090 [Lachnospiraceae bacterium]|nr:hypothetical protein [Lachnospiraceae bacterium]
MKKQKEVRIKYDKQSMKILLGTLIVGLLQVVVGMVFLAMKVSGTEISILLTLYLGGVLAVFLFPILDVLYYG